MSFFIWKVWKGRKKITKTGISSDEIKIVFIVFEELSFGEKIKIL